MNIDFRKLFSMLILFAGSVIWVGCEDFLDINEDPNNPTEVALELLLPSTQIDIAGAVGIASGGLSNITSTYTHQLVQRGQEINDYALTGDDFGVTVPWEVLYTRALTDLDIIIDGGLEEGSPHYAGVAQILKAYTYSVLVDIYGRVPYAEANQGVSNLSPSFQDGAVVYDSVFLLLDQGIANLGEETSIVSPGSDDLIYSGDLEKWEKAANTLKLKLYNQIRLVRNVSSEVNDLLANEPLIEEEADDFELPYGTSVSPDSRNPGYSQEYLGAAYYISPYFYEILKGIATFYPAVKNIYLGLEDPRIPYYFYNQLEPGEEPENDPSYWDEATGFLSIYTFSFNIDPNEGFDQSASQTVAGLYPLGGAYDDGDAASANYSIGFGDVSQRMIPFFTRKFIEAELALEGVATGVDARIAFDEAMRAAFNEVNVIAASAGAPEISSEEIDSYVDEVLERYDDADQAGKLQHIITQKWIASFGYGVDIYNDYRRTGYPVLHDGNDDFLAVTVRGREYPFSFPWPTNSIILNQNAPDQKQTGSPAARVFWDVN